MTVIAYRDGIIAGDSLVTSRGTRVGSTVKVRKAGSVLAAGAGQMSKVQGFLDWFSAGAKENPPAMGEEAEGILVCDGKILTWQDDWDMLNADFYAIGSGAQIALGAMAQGASAALACRIACDLDTGCGGPITVLSAHE